MAHIRMATVICSTIGDHSAPLRWVDKPSVPNFPLPPNRFLAGCDTQTIPCSLKITSGPTWAKRPLPQIFGSVLYFASCLEKSGECSDPTSMAPLRARRNNTMKEKVAVSVIVTLILASFCPAEAQQTAKAIPRIGFISSTGTR